MSSDFPPKQPVIKTTLPGPEATKVVERDTNALIRTTKTSPVVAKRAQGVWVEDVDGNAWLDFTSGIGVVNTGYSHPRVVEAIREQAEKLVHFAGTDFYYDEQVTLAERLAGISPGNFLKKVFFSNSGAESNEAGIKIARHASKRPRILGFYGAFHGRTMGAGSISASKVVQRRGFFPDVPGVDHAYFPNPYRNPWGIDGYAEPGELVNRCIDYIEDTLFRQTVPAEEVAAIWAEPVQGEGGYVFPPDEWFPALTKLADEHGILLAVDEVQTGFGRTGKLFASEHYGLEPDILMLAKGIASGMPMGAVVTRAEFDFEAQGQHSNTYGGNVLACKAAMATLDALTEDDLVANAATVGAHLHKRLEELHEKHEAIGDVRGLGLMQATEFVKDRASKAPDADLRDRVTEEAFKRGLVLLPCGQSVLRYIPPLVVTKDEIDVGVDVLDEAITAASR